MKIFFRQIRIQRTAKAGRRRYPLLITLLFTAFFLNAQFQSEDMAFAIEQINELRQLKEELRSNEITKSDITAVKKKSDIIVNRLSKYTESRFYTHENLPLTYHSALYYSVLAKFEYGHFLSIAEMNDSAYQQYKEIKKDIKIIDNWNFPITLFIPKEERLIPRENFDQWLSAYYGFFGFACFGLNYLEEARGLLSEAIFHPKSDQWMNFGCATHLILTKKKLNEYDQELAKTVVDVIKAFNSLPEDKKELILSDKIKPALKPDEAFAVLNEINSKKPKTKNLAECYGKIAEYLVRLGYKAEGIESLKTAIKKGNKDSFVCRYALEIAEKENDTELVALASACNNQ